MTKAHRFSLDKSTKKYTCPLCRQRTLVLYSDQNAGELFPDHVGRCDRENNCGYHYPPKQYFTEKGICTPVEKNISPEPPKLVDYLPWVLVRKCMNGYKTSHFGEYIIRLFGTEKGMELLSRYFVGRSRGDNGRANIFWRIDADGRVRTGKIMVYHPLTGKRNKDVHPVWVHNSYKPFNHELCFFGEHLINENPYKTIAICESEKTAIIASLFFPQFVWLATGGASGCKWREFSVFSVLKNRDVFLFPDFGYYNKKSGKTCFQEWKDRAEVIMTRMDCNIRMSSVLEKNIPETERVNDYDLVDMLIKRDETGIAITDEGYPIIWDFVEASRLLQ